MSIKIKLNFTSNEGKAAKVYLVEELGVEKNEFLGYAILPNEIHKNAKNKLNFNLKKNEIYCDLGHGNELVIVQGDNLKKGYANAITALFDITKLKSGVEVIFDKSWLILGLPSVEKNKIFKYSNLSIVENEFKKPVINDVIKPVTKPLIKPVPKSLNTKNNLTSSTGINSLPQNTRYRDDSFDIFDVMYMNAFPEMAPFYKPNSFLAWHIYLNNRENQEQLFNNPEVLRSVPGFENARDFNIQKNSDGSLNIGYIDDIGKNMSISCSLNNIEVSNGNETLNLSCQGNNYKLTGESIIGSTINSEIKVENGTLQYDYSISPKNVPEISGSFSTHSNLLNSLANNSELPIHNDDNRDLNIEQIKNVDMPISEQKFKPLTIDDIKSSTPSSELEQSKTSYNFTLDLEKRYEPPPPPPPPPEYGSNDPYSYSSSMSP